ncbi:unnamed protein product [Moneuplotes crassus]|uniref:Uncharacterized protein n=1 Tax=Euplotes crassus TaxID=5936 RepID=A0AAD1XDJ4_EUPCR|nr:unnamed protein product [Moneuplotes crassus]
MSYKSNSYEHQTLSSILKNLSKTKNDLDDVEEDLDEFDNSFEENKINKIYPSPSLNSSGHFPQVMQRCNESYRKQIEIIVRNCNESLKNIPDETTPLLGERKEEYENLNGYSNTPSNINFYSNERNSYKPNLQSNPPLIGESNPPTLRTKSKLPEDIPQDFTLYKQEIESEKLLVDKICADNSLKDLILNLYRYKILFTQKSQKSCNCKGNGPSNPMKAPMMQFYEKVHSTNIALKSKNSELQKKLNIIQSLQSNVLTRLQAEQELTRTLQKKIKTLQEVGTGQEQDCDLEEEKKEKEKKKKKRKRNKNKRKAKQAERENHKDSEEKEDMSQDKEDNENKDGKENKEDKQSKEEEIGNKEVVLIEEETKTLQKARTQTDSEINHIVKDRGSSSTESDSLDNLVFDKFAEISSTKENVTLVQKLQDEISLESDINANLDQKRASDPDIKGKKENKLELQYQEIYNIMQEWYEKVFESDPDCLEL